MNYQFVIEQNVSKKGNKYNALFIVLDDKVKVMLCYLSDKQYDELTSN